MKLVKIHQEPAGEVVERYVSGIGKLEEEKGKVLDEFVACSHDGMEGVYNRLRALDMELSRKRRDPLEATRTLVFLGGRFRLPWFSANI